MTTQEAIKFGELYLEMNEDSKDSDTYQFIEAAIKVLKQKKNCELTAYGECSYAETGCSECAIKAKIAKLLICNESDDTISRRDAIDAVEESRRLNHHQDGKEACAHEYEHRHFLKILRGLPPVHPEVKISICSTDCISRQDAIDAVLDRMDVEKWGRNPKPEEIRWTLERLPSAQPKIKTDGDTISRRAAIDLIADYNLSMGQVVRGIHALPSVQPYTESEIQIMQDLEQAQLDKMYELGWKEGREALRDERDQIEGRTKDDLISKRNAIYLSKRYHPTTVVDAMAYDKELRALPSAQPAWKKGHWILPRETLCEEDNIQCSICGFMSHPMIVRWNQGIGYGTVGKLELPHVCPKCHTDMRGEENRNGRSS